MPNNRTPFYLGRGDGGGLFIADHRYISGNVWFVDSEHANAGDTVGKGQSPDAPFATLNYAALQAQADNGDTILLAPGHAESISTAGATSISTNGLHIVGGGVGRGRPTFTITATAGSFDIGADNTIIENIVFMPGVDAVEEIMNISGSDVTLNNCEFELAPSSSLQATIGITMAANSDRCMLKNLHMHGVSNAGVDHAVSFNACDDLSIIGCRIAGSFSTNGVIENLASAINFYAVDNLIINYTANANNSIIRLNNSTSGMIANNRVGILDSTAPAPFTAANAFVGGNYGASTIGTAAATLI
ncbi:MAG: hypothetical protein ACFCD0_23870 [Gemmataceae bacterium]